MKITKLLTKVIATAAVGALLLTTVASASDIKRPNMGGVSVQYATLVTATKEFDDPLSASILNAVTNLYCYNEADVLKMIANTNSAIDAIKKIEFINASNTVVGTGNFGGTLVRDNGYVKDAANYLSGAQLAGAVSFSFGSSTSDNIPTALANTARPTNEYYDKVEFKVTTPLFSGTTPKSLVSPYGIDSNGKTSGVTVSSNSDIVKILEKYVTFLNAVIAFDRAAGCYDTTTAPPSDTTQQPSTPTPPATTANARLTARNRTIKVGDKFVIMEGISAKDCDGADITRKVTVSGRVNTAVPGKYSVKYSVRGLNGVVVSRTVTITVK